MTIPYRGPTDLAGFPVHDHTGVYQPLDEHLTALAALDPEAAEKETVILFANGDPSVPSLVGITGTDEFVRKTSPTIVTPTIASFASATHNHQNAAGGDLLDIRAASNTALTTTSLACDYNADAIASSDGASLSAWNDSSSNANHAGQATAGDRPVYRSQACWGAAVESVSSDVMDIGSNITLSGDFAVFVACTRSGGGTNGHVVGNASSNFHFAINRGGANAMGFRDGAGTEVFATHTATLTRMNVYAWRRTSNTVRFFENGRMVGSGTAGASTVINRILANEGDGEFTHGIFKRIAIYTDDLADADFWTNYGRIMIQCGLK